MASYDVLIVGGGPAGLNAALALCRTTRSAIVFDSGMYRNSISKHMHTVPTWDHRDSKDFRSAARTELLKRYKTTTFADEKVRSLRQLEGGIFEAITSTDQRYTGHKLILATGVKDIYPDIPGYAECWGKAVFHCLFCHGYEERGGSHAGFLAIDNCANAQFALPISGMAKNLAGKVTIYTHGNNAFAESIQADAAKFGHVVDSRKIARLEKCEGGTGGLNIHFEGGSSDHLSFLAHTPRTRQTTPFAEQLGLELTPSGDIKVEAPFNSTNVHGVFAVGDCSTPMKSVQLALANGSIAAAGAVHQLVMYR